MLGAFASSSKCTLILIEEALLGLLQPMKNVGRSRSLGVDKNQFGFLRPERWI